MPEKYAKNKIPFIIGLNNSIVYFNEIVLSNSFGIRIK